MSNNRLSYFCFYFFRYLSPVVPAEARLAIILLFTEVFALLLLPKSRVLQGSTLRVESSLPKASIPIVLMLPVAPLGGTWCHGFGPSHVSGRWKRLRFV